MFDRLSRSWALVKASATILQQDKHLMVFPIISVFAAMVVMACFALPVFGMAAFDGVGQGADIAMMVLGFAFYVVLYTVIFYFNTALVGATMMRLDGGVPTLGDGLRIANSRLGAIIGYALIAATVGMILRAIQERVGFLGDIIVGLIGAGWTAATFLVVPVLVVRDISAIEAVKESAGMLKRTWGENVIGQVGMSFAFGLIIFALISVGAVLIGLAASVSAGLAITLAVLLLLAVIFTALVQTTLTGIYSAALYRYAASGETTVGFDNGALQAAFLPKR
jgi:hypothetical protein